MQDFGLIVAVNASKTAERFNPTDTGTNFIPPRILTDMVTLAGDDVTYQNYIGDRPKFIQMTIHKLEAGAQYRGEYPFITPRGEITPAFSHKGTTYVCMTRTDMVVDGKKLIVIDWARIPIRKLTTPRFGYVITSDGCQVTTVLVETETGNTKTFVTSAGSMNGHVSHMNSLTDELCESWFNTGKRKKGKPA